MIYWITGQPGHGKTVLGTKLKEYLEKNQEIVFLIDGDDLRKLTTNTSYDKNGRYNNIKLAQNIAKYLHFQNCNVIVTLVSPYLELRESFKNELPITEIYVHTTDIRGREQYHTDYEKPIKNFIDIDTTNIPIEESFNYLLKQIENYGK